MPSKNRFCAWTEGTFSSSFPSPGMPKTMPGGRILRLQAPTKRESYDADLRGFRDTAQKHFASWASVLGAERCRTDILGSLDAAQQEFASIPKDSTRQLVVASDFLEDDDQYRFVNERALANPKTARNFASQLRGFHSFAVAGAQVCLGRLESIQFEALSPSRRGAISAFWMTYFAHDGRAPVIQLDGVGMLMGNESACLTRRVANSSEVRR